ncbi:hypothetical protein BKA65DRAFT_249725 [Rhexocercosporidium sp. MPI-PUGE-AT-0058]|nr:hypothetical protein BKA65DRAFT_249725 [Rhexocercosporidium sp. MPI-PUGE-AT-0058]
MRRPPDKEAQTALSERDVESSNATLNALFGGSRQKSWMVGAGTSVRPTPRPSVSNPSNLPTALAQKSAATVLPSPAPSDDASPILAYSSISRARNDTQQESRNDGNIPPPTSTFPPNQQDFSGDPITELSRGIYPPEPSSRHSTLSRSPNQSRRQSINPPPFRDTTTVMENPPLPSSVFLPSERQDHRHTPQELYSRTEDLVPSPIQIGTPISQQRVLSSPRLSSLSDLGITSRPAPTQQQQTNILGGPRQVSQGLEDRSQFVNSGQINTSSAARVGEVRSPMAAANMSYPSPSTSTTSNPNKRQRTQVPAMTSLKGRISLIERHIQSVGGIMNLNTGLERPRFQLLTDACRNEDPFYVALHQVFCVWDVNRQEVASIQGYPNSNILQSAFSILGQLIRDNDQLAPAHKIWFAQFPSPLSHLLSTSEPYRQTLADVGVFLTRLTSEWAPLSSECTQRGYPPLVDELVNRWQLLSPTLQSVVFTATRRNLGIRDEEVGTRMEDLFRRDQQEHQALAARMNTARPPTAKEVQERNTALVNEYLALHNQLIQRRSSTTVSGSPLMSGPTPVVPSNATRLQQNNVTAAYTPAWQQNMSSPDPAGNPQSVTQHQYGVPRTSSSSPNSALLAGRPPSVGSHRGHPNTPSPTLLQDLSMHSPAQQGVQFATTSRNSVPAQSNQNYPQEYGRSNLNGTYHQPQATNINPGAQQLNQIAIQLQQMLPQQHFRPQIEQQQYQVHPHQPVQNQLPQHHPHQYQPAQNAWQQNSIQSTQQQQAMVRQHQLQMEQQAFALNRAAQLRNDSTGDPQRAHIMNSSISSTGRHTPTARPSPRIGGQSAPVPGKPIVNEQALHAYIAKHPLNRSIVPPHMFTHTSFPALPDQVALHQAHLRSPRLVAADGPPSNVATDSPSLRHYQTIKEFALPPTRISINTPLSKFDFRPSEAQLAMIPQDILHSNGQVPNRQYRRGTLQYRVRCIQTKNTATKCPITDWVLKDTIWPEGASLTINKKHLELRRKNHHGKDLPIDVTPYVRLAGPSVSSQISLSILRGRSKMKEHSYFIAVEVIEILQHDQILDMVRKNRVSASTSLDKIKRSLAGPADDDDDDIAMVVSDLSIDLADPFTARIYDTPVRGTSCLHRECFDLETFLLTRISKPKRPGQPCMIDVWKCPLCGKDARPYSLQIDEFLVSVRQTLEAQGNLDVKAIWVGGDGTWRPKIEKRKAPPDPNDSDDSDGEAPNNTAITLNKIGETRPNRVVEVISLDDD